MKPLDDIELNPRTRIERAFTRIELLVVIGLIGILAALLLPTLNSAKEARTKRWICDNQPHPEMWPNHGRQ